MPEYLAPGVYIEEFEIGAKPIEGVSTSTGGFLGYAEMGPLNKPTLATSFADFQRVYGGYLPPRTCNGEDLIKIRWLAYAVQGFFENGGKRVFVTRVAGPDAKPSSGYLPNVSTMKDTVTLAADTNAGDSSLSLDGEVTWQPGALLLLKDDAKSEFVKFSGTNIRTNLKEKLLKDYAAGTDVNKIKMSTTKTKLGADAKKGDMALTLIDAKGIKIGDTLKVEEKDKNAEFVAVATIEDKKITLSGALKFDYTVQADITKIQADSAGKLKQKATAGDTMITLDSPDKVKKDDMITLGTETYTIADSISAMMISPRLEFGHNNGCEIFEIGPIVQLEAASVGSWGNLMKLKVKPTSIAATKLSETAAKDTDTLKLESLNGIEPGSVLLITDENTSKKVVVKETAKTATENLAILTEKLSDSLNGGAVVKSQEFNLIAHYGNNDEVFKSVSLKPNHSRYIEKVITEKSSSLLRVVKILEEGGVDKSKLKPFPTDVSIWCLDSGNDGYPANLDNFSEINKIYEGVDSMEPAKRTGLYTFKNVDEINIVALPGITSPYLQTKIINHCEIDMKDRFGVLDSVPLADLDEIKDQRNLFDSSYAALYYPWMYAFDSLTGEYTNIPPSGYVAGVYARTDTTRGVHKAPANEQVNGVFGLEKLNGKFRLINKGTQDILNPLGINCIRQFPGRGIRIWGARTVSSNSLWKYLSVRRLFLFIEESIEKGTQWVVFEPNDQKLWARVIQTIKQFLYGVWKDGALMGSTPEEAYFVKCDRSTMTQGDIDNGRLICVIGVAPVKPAEFVIFRIAQWQGGSAATE